ncbi:U32 family peptidase [Cellulosilyticum ruminicola]|uniref:U32 family peptidase n=1 Tax=Cellulosilyticum ruminicola TaxID=425254 RepID=UPI0006CF72AD|nr:U32 family peptidase [Cellulosilyticum ruminicola]
MMNYFCMPADFKKETIDKYAAINEEYKDSKIIETYGNITINNIIQSGRAEHDLQKIDIYDLQEYVAYSKEKGIDFNYTMNSPHLNNKEFTPEGIQEIKAFLAKLYEIGVRTITVALPTMIEIIQSMPYEFNIVTSTLCQVFNPNKAKELKNKSVKRVVVDESINRDFGQLKGIARHFYGNVEIIVNPICYKDCVYRMFHYNEIATDSINQCGNTSVNYYEHRCVLQRYQRISNLLRMSWIRPEDLKYYTNIGINYFKLQGRQLVHRPEADPVKTVRAYCNQDFDGDVFDLINMFHDINKFKIYLDNKKLEGFIKPFVEKDDFCAHDCEKCKYCDNFSEKVIDYKKAEEVIQYAKDFYNEFDKFTVELRKDINEDQKDKDAQLDIEFDL